jgi:hypothetical protein
VLSRAHQVLRETEAAILREWEALETEHQSLGDWHTQLEERTKTASYQFASERSELEWEREGYKKDLRRVFDHELEVTRKEKLGPEGGGHHGAPDEVECLHEREMCPWAIFQYILVIKCPTHIERVIICQMMDEVRIDKKVWF